MEAESATMFFRWSLMATMRVHSRPQTLKKLGLVRVRVPFIIGFGRYRRTVVPEKTPHLGSGVQPP